VSGFNGSPTLYHYAYLAGRMKVNMGNGRSVSQKHSIKVHRSVQTRMEKMNYVPKAKVDLSKVNDSDWVD